MVKIKTQADLKALRDELSRKMSLREKGESPEGRVHVKVAMATCGIASGAKGIIEFFKDELEKRSIDAQVTQTGCMGYCYAEPTVEVMLPKQEPIVFGYVDTKRADEIIEKYIKTGELVDGIIPVNYNSIDINP